MKQLTIYDIIEMLESKLEDRIESAESSDTEQDTPDTDNLSAHEAIDHIIEGALNTFIESSAFPTPEQAHVLLELRKLQMSYES